MLQCSHDRSSGSRVQGTQPALGLLDRPISVPATLSLAGILLVLLVMTKGAADSFGGDGVVAASAVGGLGDAIPRRSPRRPRQVPRSPSTPRLWRRLSPSERTCSPHWSSPPLPVRSGSLRQPRPCGSCSSSDQPQMRWSDHAVSAGRCR
ncbi:hypothetical protein [Rhodococcus wratislaviensis]|uniref:hypothetical protein n=1 Tax=Rhodococcus wratislaviensis TaxID=44752 RepID=UPI0020D02DF2|nr:hypothetical protein [Rhodococcus wratislaviensis]